MVITEEEDPPSKSVTDTSYLLQSQAETSERDFLKDLKLADEVHKRRNLESIQ